MECGEGPRSVFVRLEDAVWMRDTEACAEHVKLCLLARGTSWFGSVKCDGDITSCLLLVSLGKEPSDEAWEELFSLGDAAKQSGLHRYWSPEGMGYAEKRYYEALIGGSGGELFGEAPGMGTRVPGGVSQAATVDL
jgi:hypothetical protein